MAKTKGAETPQVPMRVWILAAERQGMIRGVFRLAVEAFISGESSSFLR